MIVDTSVLVAITRLEPRAEELAGIMSGAPVVMVPASCYLETCMVISGRKGRDSRPLLEELLARARATILPLTEAHARAATEAFLRYGKGRHPAALNFGDCMAYAAARVEGLPLLFVGKDFARTDVEVAGG